MLDYAEKYLSRNNCMEALGMSDKAIHQGVIWLGFFLNDEEVFKNRIDDACSYKINDEFK